jgi:hypothetical protein
MYTTQKQVRAAFWESFPEFRGEYRKAKRQNDYRTDIRVSFCDFVESLRRDGLISEKLAYSVTL